jgi:glycerol kinase
MPAPTQPADALFLAIDQGTHASRALIFDGRGRLVAEGVQEIALHRHGPDVVEQDPEELVASVFAAVERALADAGQRARQVVSAGMATQRSNQVCWERESGKALSPIISWQDRRAHAWLKQFEPHGEAIHAKTGLFLSPHYGASKLRWCLENLPAVADAQREGRLAWGPMAGFLLHRLLRERPLLVDPQNASRTQLWNIHSGDWDPELISLFGLPEGYLPGCVPTCHPFGTLPAGGVEMPLLAMNGDQSSALFGFGWPDAATAYVNVGTGAFVQRPVGQAPVLAPRLLTGLVLQDAREALYALEGTVNGAASALAWLAQEVGDEHLAERLPEWLAREEEPPLFLNGISGLGSPFWVADFPSRFEGEGEPWARAVALVESIAFLLQANMDEMERFTEPPRRVQISGGVSRLDGLCRRLADLTGLPVHRRDDPEATARGIAFLLAGRPERWEPAGEDERFAPGDNPPLRERYGRWRRRMAEEAGY